MSTEQVGHHCRCSLQISPYCFCTLQEVKTGAAAWSLPSRYAQSRRAWRSSAPHWTTCSASPGQHTAASSFHSVLGYVLVYGGGVCLSLICNSSCFIPEWAGSPRPSFIGPTLNVSVLILSIIWASSLLCASKRFLIYYPLFSFHLDCCC